MNKYTILYFRLKIETHFLKSFTVEMICKFIVIEIQTTMSSLKQSVRISNLENYQYE